MSTTEKTALGIIDTMVDKLLNDTHIQHAEDQAEVTRMRGLISACISDASKSLVKVATYKKDVQSKREAHVTCRKLEGTVNDSMSLACSTYDAYRMTTNTPSCVLTKLDSGYVKTEDTAKKVEMEACLTAANEWLTPLYEKYADCKQKRDSHSNKTQECNSKQSDVEQSYCTYSVKLEDACDTQITCRSRTTETFNDTCRGVKATEAARKADFVAASRIKCLFDVLKTSNDHKETTLLKCQNMTMNVSKFDITYHGIPEAQNCIKEQALPGQKDWAAAEYTSQTWYSKAKPGSIKSCPAAREIAVSSHAPACTGGYENRHVHVLQDSSCHAGNRIIGMGLHADFMYYACNTKIKRFALNRSASDHSPGEDVCNFPSRVNTVAVCGDGKIYSLVMSTGDFVLCDPGSKTLSTITTITSHAGWRERARTGMVQCDASNRVYIQDYMAKKLFRYSGTLPLETFGTGHDYGGMAVTTGGDVYYIGDTGKFFKRYVYNIYHVDSDGKQVEVIKAPKDGSQNDFPAALAVDATGNLFTIDYQSSLQAYNATTSAWTKLAGKRFCSDSIALGSNSDIYIGSEDGNSIRKVSCKVPSKE